MDQITNNILMIQPTAFRYNEETAVNNFYQKILVGLTQEKIQENALAEFNQFVKILKSCGVNVIVIPDSSASNAPDSIFPNNWISFHSDGTVVLYPLFAKNRRVERREDILKILVDKYHFVINEIKSFAEFEKDNKFLEGTGSMVLDRENKICYASVSSRTNSELVKKFCEKFNYEPICFSAFQNVNNERFPIYHTNVMMCVANHFVVVCLDAIDNKIEKEKLSNAILKSNKKIIEISESQVQNFAGNMLQVFGDKPYMIMSKSAFECLTKSQISQIEKYSPIFFTPLDTIEACGGGSARCMMAEVFLPKTHFK